MVFASLYGKSTSKVFENLRELSPKVGVLSKNYIVVIVNMFLYIKLRVNPITFDHEQIRQDSRN